MFGYILMSVLWQTSKGCGKKIGGGEACEIVILKFVHRESIRGISPLLTPFNIIESHANNNEANNGKDDVGGQEA